MSNPAPGDGPPVPILVENVVDADLLRQLFADLTQHAQMLSIQEKADPTAYTQSAPLTLEDALSRLLGPAPTRIQLRYRFDQTEWIDTILTTPTGYRVLRCQCPSV
jgi:hypothetical protein